MQPTTGGLSHSGPLLTNNQRKERSGNDVGDERVFQKRYFVTQAELAFFQSGDLHLVTAASIDKGFDRAIKVAMLDSQQFQPSHDIFPAHPLPTFSAMLRTAS